MGFYRQEYWSGLPFLSPGDLPDPGIRPGSPALAGGCFTPEPPGKVCLGIKRLFKRLILILGNQEIMQNLLWAPNTPQLSWDGWEVYAEKGISWSPSPSPCEARAELQHKYYCWPGPFKKPSHRIWLAENVFILSLSYQFSLKWKTYNKRGNKNSALRGGILSAPEAGPGRSREGICPWPWSSEGGKRLLLLQPRSRWCKLILPGPTSFGLASGRGMWGCIWKWFAYQRPKVVCKKKVPDCLRETVKNVKSLLLGLALCHLGISFKC